MIPAFQRNILLPSSGSKVLGYGHTNTMNVFTQNCGRGGKKGPVQNCINDEAELREAAFAVNSQTVEETMKWNKLLLLSPSCSSGLGSFPPTVLSNYTPCLSI
jgi:hypothetical protein